jgi:hypothetical protein
LDDSSLVSSSESSDCFAQAAVNVLAKLQEYAICLSDGRNDYDTNLLLLLTTWESLPRYLLLMQKHMERQQVQALLLQHKRGSRVVPQQSVNRLAEAIITCQREWILLHNKSTYYN